MFTGIAEEIGVVTDVKEIAGGKRITIKADEILNDLMIGNSINVDGACQTVVGKFSNTFSVETVGETLEKTTFMEFRPGRKVNLERAIKANGRLDGHFVLGHVNGVAKIHNWYPRGENYFLELGVPGPLLRYIVPEGSVAVDGISLTVARMRGGKPGINIIPHTARFTTLQYKKAGDSVNIEVDILMKYIERILTFNETRGITPDTLNTWGY